MFTVALTGGIGSGKSVVADLFAKMGVPIIDTDIIARDLVQPGKPALADIKQSFGRDVIKKNGELDRVKLARLTFSSTRLRKQLEDILHPRIHAEIRLKLQKLESPYAIIVIPLLVETGQVAAYNRVLVVDCDESTQMSRVIQRDRRSEDQIRAIMEVQAKRPDRLSWADDIIENNGTLQDLEQKVAQLHQAYLKMAET
ncbi:MAG: dephospho-CoA kinase [Gammaproteobacteria bacterium]|nr:dephospho-CoA kinase [Gammaproteobacteria bacterium]